jgi:hypothetical protein
MSVGGAQARTNAELAAGLSRLSSGLCLGINWAEYLVTVNVGGGNVDIPMAGIAPTIGDRVWIGYLGNQPVCLGPVPRPTTGTVASAPTGAAVIVTGDDGRDYSVAYDVTAELAAGYRVGLDWSIPGGFVLGRLSSDAALLAPRTPTAPAPQMGSATFNPTASGTWSSTYGKWQTSEVWSSSSTLGAWFYEGVASTIPDGAVIDSVRVYVDSLAILASGAPTIGLHSLSSKGGNGPTVTDAVAVASGSGWKSLPTSFGDALKTGARLGLGTNHGGYHKWSPAGVRNSGALEIRWH